MEYFSKYSVENIFFQKLINSFDRVIEADAENVVPFIKKINI